MVSSGCGDVANLSGQVVGWLGLFCVLARKPTRRCKRRHTQTTRTQGPALTQYAGAIPAGLDRDRRQGITTHQPTKPATDPHRRGLYPLALPAQEVSVRLYNAICEVLESYAARLQTDTLENEFDNADWAKAGGWTDEDD